MKADYDVTTCSSDMSLALGSHFAMRQPEGWEAFHDFASELVLLPDIGSSTKAWYRQGVSLGAEIAELSNETLEEYRYYSIGLSLCELAKVQRDPNAQQEAAEDRAHQIVTGHEGYCAGYGYDPNAGMYINELLSQAVRDNMPISKRAARNVPVATRLASDVLKSAKRVRLGLQEDPQYPYSLNDWLSSTSPGDSVIQSMEQLASASSAITILALRNMHNKGAAIDPQDRSRANPLLRDVIEPAELQGLDLLQIAGYSAGLRLDEFENVQAYLVVDPNGLTTFKTTAVSRDPEPLLKDTTALGLIHHKRLRCPALYINGMIKLALQVVTESASISARLLR